jgi:glycosyltransferase involved in cell wall biosynthesis
VRVIARLNVGGPARQVCFLHQHLGERFLTILIAGKVDEDEADMSYLLQSQTGVRWLESLSRPVRIWQDLRTFFKLLSLLRQEKPDILHTHTAKAGALGRVAGFLLGVPVIVHTYHGHVFAGYFGRWKTRLVIMVERMLNRITTRVIAISDSQAQELSEVYNVVKRAKVSVIRTGHDLSSYRSGGDSGKLRERLGLSSNHKIVVWAGRMVPIKNVRLLAEIICAAAKEDPSLHFVIVGDGPDRTMFQQLIGDTRATLLGWQSDMSEIWRQADIALGTSLNEGTPAAFIEAMAAGKPFVSTDVGGVLDLTVNARKVNGQIVADNAMLCTSSAKELLSCIMQITSDPTLASKMGESGREFVEHYYTAEQMAANHSNLYERLSKEV